MMTAPRRVLMARISHETHNFVEGTTSFDKFTIDRDADVIAKADDASTIGGFLEVARKNGWDLIPTVSYRAQPSATVDQAVFEQFWSELEERIDRAMS